jgi:CRISPR-associated protein Csm4
MKRFQVTLAPRSFFKTPLRGDILFGHLCWQFARYPHIVKGGLDGLLSRYNNEPDIVVSDPIYFGTINNLNSEFDELFVPAPPECCFEEPLRIVPKRPYDLSSSTVSNLAVSVKKDFIVYPSCDAIISSPIQCNIGCKSLTPVFNYPDRLIIDVLVNPNSITSCGIEVALTNVGKYGYGGGANRGFGRFIVENIVNYEVACAEDIRWWITLAPSVPTSLEAHTVLFEPVRHHGKHSSELMDEGQYKKSVLRLASSGAVILGKDKSRLKLGYCGRALTNVSLAHNRNTVHQGYSPVYPLKLPPSLEESIIDNLVFKS